MSETTDAVTEVRAVEWTAAQKQRQHGEDNESLVSQIDRLAALIVDRYPHEIGRGGSEGAVDVAIRLLREHPTLARLTTYLTRLGRYGDPSAPANDPVGVAIALLEDPLVLLLGTETARRVRLLADLRSAPGTSEAPVVLLRSLLDQHVHRHYGGWAQLEEEQKPAPEGVLPVIARRFGAYLDVVAKPVIQGDEGPLRLELPERAFQPDTLAQDERGSQRRYVLEYPLGRRIVVDPMPDMAPPLVAYELHRYRIGTQFDEMVATPRCARCALPTSRGEDVVLSRLTEDWTPPPPVDGVYGVVQIQTGKHGLVHLQCARRDEHPRGSVA